MPFQPGRGKLAYEGEVHIETGGIPVATVNSILQRLQSLAHTDATINTLVAGKAFTLLFENLKTFTT
jgi:hypothetical protein